MANFINKTLDFLKLTYDDDDEYDYEFEDESFEAAEEASEKKEKKESSFGASKPAKETSANGGSFFGKKKDKADKEQPVASKTENRSAKGGFSGVSSVVRGGKKNMESEIVSIRPKDDSARLEIADNLLQNKTVLINMETLDLECAQRIVDFVAGVCYAIKGDMRFPSKYLVVAVPDEVELTGKYEDSTTK